MKLGLRRFLKKGQKGLTLVELMVVMAILAVLASIVFPAVSGTQEVSVDSQAKQDASTVSNALADHFADQTGAEIITTKTTSLLGSGNTTKQIISNRWAETYLQDTYTLEFPTANVTGQVMAVNITDKADAGIGASSSNTTILTGWNAIDLATLATENYMPAIPKSSTDADPYNNYLWLVKKTTASGGVEGGSRDVGVFKLVGVTKAEGTNDVTLVYKQIY